MPASPAASHEGHRKGAQQAGESAGVRTRRVAGRAAFWRIGARTSAPPNGPNRPSRSAQRHASHAGIHGHPTPGQPPRQPRASEQRTRSAPTHPIRRGAMPTDRVHRHRQQAQTRKREVNTGTTRPPQARRSSTRSGLNATPQNPGLHNVSVTWARQVVALTLSCAAGPDTWSMGTPAHAPPIGLTCASKGPSTHPTHRAEHAIQQRDEPGYHNMSSSPTSAPWSAGHTPPAAGMCLMLTPPLAQTNPGLVHHERGRDVVTCPGLTPRERSPSPDTGRPGRPSPGSAGDSGADRRGSRSGRAATVRRCVRTRRSPRSRRRP